MAQTLDDFHAALETMMADGDALLATRDPAHTVRVKQRVAEAVMLVASYQIFVHREVFAPMLAGGDPSLRARVMELKVECIALTEDLRFNTKDFIANDTPIDWERMAARVAWFNGRVRQHLARVREALSTQSDAEFAASRAARTARVEVLSAL
jgi:hypothetical protein